jgi:hypothetical protein
MHEHLIKIIKRKSETKNTKKPLYSVLSGYFESTSFPAQGKYPFIESKSKKILTTSHKM